MTSSEEKATSSAYGIVAYIADFYGMTSTFELLRRLKITAPKSPMSYTKELVHSVRNNKKVYQDVERFMPWLKTITISEERFPTIPYSKKFKACKQCLAERVLHQDKWQKPFYTHCDKHHLLLVDGCEHIYADASWPDELCCKRCTTDAELTSLPHFLHYYFSITDDSQAQSFIEKLIKLAERMVRPFDFINVQLAWERLSTVEISQILDDAYLLGATQNTYEIWSETVKQRRASLDSLGKTAQEYGLDDLKKLIKGCDWDWSENVHISVETILNRYHTNETVTWLKIRNHILSNDTPDDIANRASNWLVTELLDVDASALPELVSKGALPVKKPALRTDKLIFDIHDVDIALKEIFSWPLYGHIESITIDNVSKRVLDTLLLNRKLITQHLLTGRLRGFWAVNSTSNLINRTTLCADSLKKIYEYELAHSDHMPIKRVAEFLGIRVPGVRYLVKNGYLRLSKWQRTPLEYIDIESLQELMKGYLCLNREAILKDTELTDLVSTVGACCGLKPAIDHIAFKDNVRVVLFEKSSLNDCCILGATNQLEALHPVGIDLSKKVQRFANAC